jgi:predicted nucleic acid-binding protein
MEILVDSNVILDIVTEDKKWFTWSSQALELYAENHILVINPIIYAEVSVSFERIEDLEEVLPPDYFRRDQLPWEAGFLAGKCFRDYPISLLELTPLLLNSHY